MSKILRSAPFVTFPTRNGLTPSSEMGLGSSLEFLGHSTSGDLYLNKNLASVGLVCGGLSEDVENTVKRLASSYLSDPDAQVLIFYSDSSTIGRKACPLTTLSGQDPKILVSPRTVESISRLYESLGATPVPLCLKECVVTTQHLLSLFTPLDMHQRSSILNTVQLVINQLREPFDLQHFIKLIERKEWMEDQATFMELRQTILTGLLSSSQANVSFSSQREIIVDLGDPILSSTGMECVLMDIILQQVLYDDPRRKRLVVVYNAHEYLSASSLLSRSLEALATSGRNSPTAVIIATPSPSNIPPSIFKGLDYMVCGLARFAIWESTLHGQLSIHLPRSQWDSDHLIIWSPDSRSIDYTGDQDPAKWDDRLMIIDVHELAQTMPEPPTRQIEEIMYSNGAVQAYSNFGTPMRATIVAPPSRSWLPRGEDGEGILPLDSVSVNSAESSGAAFRTEPTDAFDTVGSSTTEELFHSSIFTRLKEAPDVREMSANPWATSTTEITSSALLPEWTEVEKKQVPLENQYPDLFRPLVSGVLTLSAHKVGVWVDFEELRKLVGDKKTLQTLGWGTFTSYVKTSNEQKILELRYKAKEIKSIKLLPITAREKYVKSLTPVALALATCPVRFRLLADAIFKAGGNDIQAKVPTEDVITHLSQPLEDLQGFALRGDRLPYWFQQAIEGKWIRSGKVKNGTTWFGLGSKLRSLAESPSALPKAGGGEVHTSQHHSSPGGSEGGAGSGNGWA